jgi:hypothetical protein
MITAVIIAWGAIALFLVALPLAAWWFGGRRFWNRTFVVEVDELRRAVAGRHGLRPVDVSRVEAAVTWGRALDTPQLRGAAVDWAHGLVEINQRRRDARPRLRALLVVVLALWLTAVVARVVFAVAQQRWGDVNWLTLVWWTGTGVVLWRMNTGPQRAIELNSGTPAP